MKFNDKINSFLDEFEREYTSAAERSRSAKLAELRPGERAPETGRIYGEAERDAFMEKARNIYARAHDVIMEQEKTVEKMRTDPPSADAVNAISLFKMRNTITPGDLDSMLDRYGDNYQAYKAIVSVGADHGVRSEEHAFLSHPVDIKAENLRAIDQSIKSLFNLDRAEKYDNLSGVVGFLKAEFDRYVI